MIKVVSELLRRDVLDRLKAISSEELSPEDLTSYYEEIHALPNSRGAALLLAIHLEDALTRAIVSRIKAERREKLKSNPTFERKIKIAHENELIIDSTRDNLEVIRKIRNAFAHSIKPLTFETPAIAEACKLLHIPKSLPPTAVATTLDADPGSRQIYQQTCHPPPTTFSSQPECIDAIKQFLALLECLSRFPRVFDNAHLGRQEGVNHPVSKTGILDEAFVT